MLTTPICALDERVLPFAPDQIWPMLLGWLLPLGKIHSKFMREVLERLEAEGRRSRRIIY